MKFNFFEKIITPKSPGSLSEKEQERAFVPEEQNDLSVNLPEASYVPSREEEALLSAEKISLRKTIEGGTYDPVFFQFENGESGIFKSWGWQKERAAYLASRLLGLDVVPPTVIREVETEEGSLQKFIPDASGVAETSLSLEGLSESQQEDLMRIWLLDLVIGNIDRHDGNLLVKGDNVYAIDHGESFYKSGFYNAEEIKDTWNSWELCGSAKFRFFDKKISQPVIQKFTRFNSSPGSKNLLQGMLEDLLGKDPAASCMARLERIGAALGKEGMLPAKIKKAKF